MVQTRVGDDPCRLNFSIATMRSEIAAGVTPEILEACPIVAGFTLVSFSSTSRENPETDT